jgi:hypothetical protein
MNVKISVYDFFAYAIPGGLILFIIAYALIIFGLIPFDVLLLSPSLAQITVIIGLAYVIGLLFEPIGKFWYRLFRPKNYLDVALTEFKELHPLVDVNFEAIDWTILFALIKRQNLDVAADMERVNATNIMLRNISFGLITLAIIEFVKFVLVLTPLYLALSVLAILFSIIAGKESVKYAHWFYLGIFENIASQALQVSELVRIKQEKGKLKNSRR